MMSLINQGWHFASQALEKGRGVEGLWKGVIYTINHAAYHEQREIEKKR